MDKKYVNENDFPYKFPSMCKTLNFKEDVRVGWDMVLSAIFTLLTTPVNNLPYTPSLGFDLDEFLFRVTNSDEMTALETELSQKIQIVTGNADITTSITVQDRIVYIDVVYTKDAKESRIPIRINRDKNEIRIKDILVK